MGLEYYIEICMKIKKKWMGLKYIKIDDILNCIITCNNTFIQLVLSLNFEIGIYKSETPKKVGTKLWRWHGPTAYTYGETLHVQLFKALIKASSLTQNKL